MASGIYMVIKASSLLSDEKLRQLSVGMCCDAVWRHSGALTHATHWRFTQGPDPCAPPSGVHPPPPPPPPRPPLLCGSSLCNDISSLLQELKAGRLLYRRSNYRISIPVASLQVIPPEFFLLFVFKMVHIVLGSPYKYSLTVISISGLSSCFSALQFSESGELVAGETKHPFQQGGFGRRSQTKGQNGDL